MAPSGRVSWNPGEETESPIRIVAAAAQGDPLERYMAYLTRYVGALVPAAVHAVAAFHETALPVRHRVIVMHAQGSLAESDPAAVYQRYREVEHADPFHPSRWDESRAVLIGTPEVGAVPRSSSYVDRFLDPLGLGPQLVLYLRDRLRLVGQIGLARNRGDPDFDDRDRRALLLCHPLAQYSFALARRVAHDSARPSPVRTLTGRERDVLGLLASGATNDQIAQALSLSPETVKTHLSRLYRKFGAHNRTELVMRLLDEL